MKNLSKKTKTRDDERNLRDGVRKRKLKPVPKNKYKQKAYDYGEEEE